MAVAVGGLAPAGPELRRRPDPVLSGKASSRVMRLHDGGHLRSVRDDDHDIAYFRADDRYEIDFVTSVNGDSIGVEVTSAKTVDDEKLAKVAAAGLRLGAKRLLVVHGGLFEGERRGIRLIPRHRFLSDPRAALSAGAR